LFPYEGLAAIQITFAKSFFKDIAIKKGNLELIWVYRLFVLGLCVVVDAGRHSSSAALK
jgi:hypothetical protein